MMKSDLQVLKDVRALLRQGWCRGSFAKDRQGNHVSFSSPDADSFCLSGAIMRSGGFDSLRALFWDCIGYKGIAEFNDKSTKSGVLTLIDRVENRLLLINKRRKALMRMKL